MLINVVKQRFQTLNKKEMIEMGLLKRLKEKIQNWWTAELEVDKKIQELDDAIDHVNKVLIETMEEQKIPKEQQLEILRKLQLEKTKMLLEVCRKFIESNTP